MVAISQPWHRPARDVEQLPSRPAYALKPSWNSYCRTKTLAFLIAKVDAFQSDGRLFRKLLVLFGQIAECQCDRGHTRNPCRETLPFGKRASMAEQFPLRGRHAPGLPTGLTSHRWRPSRPYLCNHCGARSMSFLGQCRRRR